MIETARLLLIPASKESLRAEATRDLARFSTVLGVAEPEAWPPDLYDDDAMAFSLRALEATPQPTAWTTYYFAVRGTPPVLVGAGGFVSAPRDGDIELGYSILAAHRRRGYAREATAGMVARAFQDRAIERVIAHTYPDLVASIGVLEQNGFRLEGPGAEDGTVRYVRTR